MENQLRYKNHFGSVQFSVSDNVYYGKIEDVDDLVTYEGNSKAELKTAFYEAVEDYIELLQAVK